VPTEFTVLDVHDVPSLEEARRGKMDKLIKYELADGRRRYVRVPADGANEARIIEAVRKDLGELRNLAGKKFSA